MKKLIYLFGIIALSISCEQESVDEIPNSQEVDFNQKSSTSCNISGPEIVEPDSFATYVISGVPPAGGLYGFEPRDFRVWRISGTTDRDVNGNIIVNLYFGSTFTCGTFTAFFSNNSGFQCRLSISISTADNINNCDCKNEPPSPETINSQFATPVPNEYIPGNLGQNYICTGTVNNTLSVPFEACTDYSWSISPSGNNAGFIYPSVNEATVGVKQPGRYNVILTTSNENGKRTEQFILFAENCNNLDGGGFGF